MSDVGSQHNEDPERHSQRLGPTCPKCGAIEHDLLGHQVQGVYDGVLYWECMKCGHAWARDWEPGSRREYRARELVDAHNRGAAHRLPSPDPE